MLLVSNVNSNNLQKRKSNLSFGTNLIISKDAADCLEKNPNDKQQVQKFKDFLAKDGKDWNAELTYDKFMKSDKTPEQIVEEKMNSEDWRERIEAGDQIKNINDSEKTAIYVQKMVNDKEQCVCVEGASVAGDIKDPKIAARIIVSLLQNSDSAIRCTAAGSVGKINSTLIASGLIMNLSKNPEDEIRENSAASAGDIKDEIIKNEIILNLAASDNVAVKRGIARALRDVKDSNVFETAATQLYATNDDKVKINTLQAIRENNKVERSSLTDSIIEEASKSKHCNVRKGAAEAIVKMVNQEKEVELIDKLAKDDDIFIRRDAINALGSLKDANFAAEKIQQIIKISDSEINKASAVESIGNIKDKRVKSELIEKLTNSNDPVIKSCIIRYVGEFKDAKKALLLIEDVYQNGTEHFDKSNAMKKIGAINDDKIRNQLLEKYSLSPNAAVRKDSIKAVVSSYDHNPQKSKRILTILSQDEDASVREEAKYELNFLLKMEKNQNYSIKITKGDKTIGKENVGKDIFRLSRAYCNILVGWELDPSKDY